MEKNKDLKLNSRSLAQTENHDQVNDLVINHEQVLESLLGQIKPIDFALKAGVATGDKIAKQDIVVIAIDSLIDLSKKHKWGILVQNSQVSVYNGAYWKIVEPPEVKQFLGKAASLMGFADLKSRYHTFVDDLYKQFQSAGYTPQRAVFRENIKINFKNGTLEIMQNGKLYFREFVAEDYFFYQLAFDYDPSATTKVFKQFVNRVLVDEKEQMILSEYCGYIFIRNSTLKLEKALILYGIGANGKSTFFEVLYALLQNENISTFSLQTLTNESGYQRAQIQNKLLNYASEIGVKMDSTIFKQLSSGEPVEARLPYGNPFIIENYAKLIFNTNELPKEVENNPAFFRRFIILSFDQTIPEAERDPEMAQKIINSELPGVFNWIIEGMKRLLDQKAFSDSPKSQRALEDYKRQSDSVAMMIAEINYHPGYNKSITLKKSYEYYKTYCADSGFKPCAINRYSDRLRKLGFAVERNKHGNLLFFENFLNDDASDTLSTPLNDQNEDDEIWQL
jgi:putative DNA primase/helicase